MTHSVPTAPLSQVQKLTGFIFVPETSNQLSSAIKGAGIVQKGRPEAERSGSSKWHIGHGSLFWQLSWHLSQLAAAKGRHISVRQLYKTTKPRGRA